VDELPEAGRLFHFHETEAWFESRFDHMEEKGGLSLARPVNVDLELIPETDQVRLQGKLQTTVRIECSRCLQEFAIDLDEAFAFTLLRPLPAETPEEMDLRPEDLDTAFYDGTAIDLDLIISEQIFLALPQKPLCQPDCQGLCQSCGADLNHESCRCEHRTTGSAFDILRSVKIDE
jgi:uncharacterized protein